MKKPELKLGQIVKNDRYGLGIVCKSGRVVYLDEELGLLNMSSYFGSLAGWEQVEVVKPGHVQVKVDDLSGQDIDTRTTPYVGTARLRKAWLAWKEQQLPEEPQGFGAKVTVTKPDGEIEQWLRRYEGYPKGAWNEAWISSSLGARTWTELCTGGTVTLGWDEEG